MRVNTYDANGNIIETTDIDYLNNLKEVKEQSIEQMNLTAASSRAIVLPKVTTGSLTPDQFSLYVETNGNYISDFKIIATDVIGSSVTYYKNNSWNTGNTENFYYNLLQAQGDVSSIKLLVGGGLAFLAIKTVLEQYVSTSILVPSIAHLKLAYDALGLSYEYLLPAAVASVSYLTNLGQCQYYYNQL